MTNLVLGRAAVFVIAALAAGCETLTIGLGPVCDPLGRCNVGVVIRGGFCLPGDEERYPACEDETAPPPDPEPDEPTTPIPPPPPDESTLSAMAIRYDSNFGISIAATSPTGIVQLYEDNVLKASYVTSFATVGNVQTFADPGGLANAIESDADSVESYYELVVRPPELQVSTGAPQGATVLLSATAENSGIPVMSKTMAYEAGPNGGLPSVDQDYGGPN